MSVKPLGKLLEGERLVGIHPTMAPTVDTGWHRRLNLFTGRSLSHLALTAEQDGRAGRLATMGHFWSPGVVSGLKAELDFKNAGGNLYNAPELVISSGTGMSPFGEDVWVPRPVRVSLLALPVRLPDVAEGVDTVASLRDRLAGGEILPAALIVVLQPVVTDYLGNFDDTDPCAQDPDNYAFEDQQLVDGCRLLLFGWPAAELGALPGDSALFRNQLAHAIFGAEKNLPKTGLLPWETVGVPLGVVETDFSTVWELDRHSVVRFGGLFAPRTTLVEHGGSPSLHQARLEQFVEQVMAIPFDDLTAFGLGAYFGYLPPVGVLPPTAIAVRGAEADEDDVLPLPPGNEDADQLPLETIFPFSVSLSAFPVQLEAVDDVIRESISLESIDLYQADVYDLDQIEIAVPVPQAWFDPLLLKKARVDQEFLDTIRYLLGRLVNFNQKREENRGYENNIAVSLTGEAIEAPEPDEIDGEVDANAIPVEELPDDEQLSETDLDIERGSILDTLATNLRTILGGGDSRLSVLLRGLASQTEYDVSDIPEADPIDPVNTNFVGAGLSGFIDFLQDKINYVNNTLQFGYLRVESELFRVKQHMVGNLAGTRMATSPALAPLAKSVHLRPTAAQLEVFSRNLSQEVSISAANVAAGLKSSPKSLASDADKSASGLSEEKVSYKMAAPAAPPSAAAGGAYLPGSAALYGGDVRYGDFQMESAEFLPGASTDMEALYVDSPSISIQYGVSDLSSTTLEQRLEVSPSVASQEKAVETKATSFEAVVDIHRLGISMDDMLFPGFIDQETSDETKFDINQIESAVDGNEIYDGKHDVADLTIPDESAYFSTAVRSLENTVLGYRLVENRLVRYQRALNAAVTARTKILTLKQRVEIRIAEIQDAMDELRMDVTVARSLLDEETARCIALNKKRRAVIDEQVPFLVFRRARTIDAAASVPMRFLESGLLEDPIRACLSSDFEAPDQLRAMVDLLRDAPIRWLEQMPALLRRLNRVCAVHETLDYAVHRAQNPKAYVRKPWQSPTLQGGVAGARIQKAFSAQLSVLEQHRIKRAGFDASIVKTASILNSYQKAEELSSIGDLIDARHGRLDASRRASELLENIYRVAACLYTRFREIPPLLRLDWADEISEFDDTVNFRNLSNLKRWDQIDHLDRRDMQTLVDWLYQQFNSKQTDAVAFVHDLIRVALLLASHAPVQQIISANVIEPAPIFVGGLIRIQVSSAVLRLGMNVQLFGATVAATAVGKGIIHDMSEGVATVKVMQCVDTQVPVMTAHISEPDNSPVGPLLHQGGPIALLK